MDNKELPGPAAWVPDFVLASASQYRLDLLKAAGLPPKQTHAPQGNETPLPDELPTLYVRRIAGLKAAATAQKYPGRCVIAADTVVAVGRRIIGKAMDETQARSALKLLSGRRHRVVTGLCVIKPDGHKIERTVTTVVILKKLTPADEARIIASKEWQNVSGYRIEGVLSSCVRKIIGSYPNILGMPVYEVSQILSGLPRR